MSRGTSLASLLVLCVLALGIGLFAVISPWLIGFPMDPGGGWTASIRSSLWVGGAVAVASALALVALPAAAIAEAVRRRSRGE